MSFIIDYQWGLFISLEVLSLLFLMVFLVIRYAFTKQRLSVLFLLLFLFCMVLEAALAWLIYRETGEFSTFQIVIVLFLVYACTFGIGDFKKLDRFIKQKVGNWRGINLLTEEDVRQMERAKDPQVVARKNRIWWYTHAAVFVMAQTIFWHVYGDHSRDLMYYLSDLSWYGDEDATRSPYTEDIILQITQLWTLILTIDTIVSWSYTVFPEKKK